MSNFTKTKRFSAWLESLTAMPSTPMAENLYSNSSEGKVRLANLTEYFRRMGELSPKLLLVGEAPGYQGTRRTGVPFASEHIISGGMPEVEFFKNATGFTRAYLDKRIYKEPTSTIMWRTISQYNALPLLWAVYPLHPHQPNNLESNRTPTRAEVTKYKPQLVELIELTGVEQVLALGNIAKATLDELGVESIKLRHPARGGGRIFAEQLDKIMNSQ